MKVDARRTKSATELALTALTFEGPIMLKPFLLAGIAAMAVAATVAPPPHVTVSLPRSIAHDASGRLLLFMEPATPKNRNITQIDVDRPDASAVLIVAKDVASFGFGHTATIKVEDLTQAEGTASIAAGSYRIQAVLDRDGNYGYAGRGVGDIVSSVVTVRYPLRAPVSLRLSASLPPERGQFDTVGLPPAAAQQIAASRVHLHDERLVSPRLSRFHGKSQHINAWVLTPPGYDPAAPITYPTVYTAGGFGTSHKLNGQLLSKTWHMMETGAIPPMIWVALDYSTVTGTSEFADSANNGPWGRALIRDVIPQLERRYRMDATPSGRFLTGHSSGGWFALWTMVTNPALFGGAWATSPDPVDFRDFLGVDLYASTANMYRDETGKVRPLERDAGKVLLTIEQEARREEVLGRDGIGGQLRSFEWVFSPRRADGRPARLFDRDTGRIDPAVAQHWRDNYDISRRILNNWPQLERDLDGKIHVRVGTVDSHYLEGSVRRLETSLKQVNARADITYALGATHSMREVYARDGVPNAYWKEMTAEMQAIARGRRP